MDQLPQETTGASPYKMMFGREATLCIDLIMGKPPNQEGVTLDSSEYAYHLRDWPEDIFEMTSSQNWCSKTEESV